MAERHYEIMILVHPDREDQVGAMVERYQEVISSNGGVIHRKEIWGRQQLAYPIDNLTKASYLLLNIACDKNAVNELKKLFRFSDSVLRSLVIRVNRAFTEPTNFMLKKLKDEQSKKEKSKNSSRPSTEKPSDTPAAGSASDTESNQSMSQSSPVA